VVDEGEVSVPAVVFRVNPSLQVWQVEVDPSLQALQFWTEQVLGGVVGVTVPFPPSVVDLQ